MILPDHATLSPSTKAIIQQLAGEMHSSQLAKCTVQLRKPTRSKPATGTDGPNFFDKKWVRHPIRVHHHVHQ